MRGCIVVLAGETTIQGDVMFDEFGERYRGSNGNTYIVVEPRENGRGHALLLEDFEILENPSGFDWEPSLIADDEIDGPVRIEDNPEMTRLVQLRKERIAIEGAVWAKVPADQHQRFYNAMVDVQRCTVAMEKAQEEVLRYAGIRARELQKMVDIAGSQSAVARLLDVKQSTISRALRHQDD
jgi:hypothetical protein